jgi:cbb3-type cytochrome oxidase maturation protein
MDSALIMLIPISVVVVGLIVVLLWWAARSGQFDDMEGPAHAILMDDDAPRAAEASGMVGAAERKNADDAQKPT